MTCLLEIEAFEKPLRSIMISDYLCLPCVGLAFSCLTHIGLFPVPLPLPIPAPAGTGIGAVRCSLASLHVLGSGGAGAGSLVVKKSGVGTGACGGSGAGVGVGYVGLLVLLMGASGERVLEDEEGRLTGWITIHGSSAEIDDAVVCSVVLLVLVEFGVESVVGSVVEDEGEAWVVRGPSSVVDSVFEAGVDDEEPKGLRLRRKKEGVEIERSILNGLNIFAFDKACDSNQYM